MKFQPFRHTTHLVLWLFCTAVFLTSIFSFLVVKSMREHFTNELTERLWVEAELIAANIELTGLTRENQRVLEKSVKAWSRAGEGRVTVIDRQGQVWAESGVEVGHWDDIQNHKDRPEIQQALKGERASSIRWSDTIKQYLLYAAVPLRSQGRVGGVIRLAMPLSEVENRLRFIRQSVLTVAAIVLVVTVGVVVVMGRALAAPMNMLAAFAEEIRQGRYNVKVPVEGSTEHRLLASTLNTIAARVSQSLNDMEHEKAQLQAVLSSMVEAVFVLDSEGKLVLSNTAAGRLFNFDVEGARSKHYLEVLRHSELDRLLSKVLLARAPQEEEVRIFSPEEHIFEAYVIPLTQKTEFSGVLAVLHDVSRLKALEKVRRDFVANVSHELKTPLAAIKGYAETLLTGGLEDRQNRVDFVRSIENQTERMIRLVDDLLDLAAIESNERRPRLTLNSLKELVEETVLPLSALAFQKKLTVLTTLPDNFPWLRCDREQIKQVLTNLLENAIKYTPPEGSITISGSEDSLWVSLSVTDTGPGIAQKDITRVFERFYRVDKARSRQEGGTGLGLSIAKHIIEAHGGRVGVESHEGAGSKFFIQLPKTLLMPAESMSNR